MSSVEELIEAIQAHDRWALSLSNAKRRLGPHEGEHQTNRMLDAFDAVALEIGTTSMALIEKVSQLRRDGLTAEEAVRSAVKNGT